MYPEEEVRNFRVLLVEEYLSLSGPQAVLEAAKKLTESEENRFNKAIQALKNHIPVQHVIGHTKFFELPFKVTNDTLIPRPETEELVAWILESTNEHFSLLDIGTGTGCIPISIAYNKPKAKVTAIDVSENALQVARQNASYNHVSIDFITQDILEATTLPSAYDVVVSNPPYIRELEKQEIQPNVLDHEPHLALFVSDEDPLLFYRQIAQLAKSRLKTGGYLFFEINEYLGQDTVILLKLTGFKTVELRKDMYGKDRMIRASLD